MKTPMKVLLIAASVATAHVATANTLTVLGSSDPLLAAGGTDIYYSDSSTLDQAPDQSPVLAGSVTAGNTISWSATGSTGNTPSISGAGPDGNGSAGFQAVLTGGTDASAIETAASSFSANLNSLVGIFIGSNFADLVELGASGSIVVPTGASELYLGSMDGYQWNNNSGSFTVDITGTNVPDGGLTAGLLGGALVGLGALRRKWSV